MNAELKELYDDFDKIKSTLATYGYGDFKGAGENATCAILGEHLKEIGDNLHILGQTLTLYAERADKAADIADLRDGYRIITGLDDAELNDDQIREYMRENDDLENARDKAAGVVL